MMRGMTLTPAEEEVDVDVRWEDQQKICEFARYNRMKSEYEEDMKTLEEKLQGLEDAEQDVEEAFLGEDTDDAVKVAMGTTFISVEEEEAEEYISRLRKQYENEKRELETKKAEVVEKMEGLKKQLYSRFGRSINLET